MIPKYLPGWQLICTYTRQQHSSSTNKSVTVHSTTYTMLLLLFNLVLWPAGLFLVIYFALYITGWFSGGVCTSKRRLDGKFVVITGISSNYCFENFKNN